MKISAHSQNNRRPLSSNGATSTQATDLLAGPLLAEDAALLTELLPGDDGLWRQSVLMWLEWHEAQQRLTAAMFASRHDSARQAELMEQMDQLDQLRWRAVELSQELLGHAHVS